MDIRFGMWNVISLYKIDSLMTDVKEISIYKLHVMEYKRSDGAGVAPNQKNIHFSMNREMRIMN
jgi:formate-dependent phosphoribosylglycinamide formyltransferase (GAR transformylase)